MKIVGGVLKRGFFHGGSIRLYERAVRYRTTRPAITDGIVYVTEDRKVADFFETMPIAANIQLGILATGVNPLPVVALSESQQLARQWTSRLSIRAIDPNAKVIELIGGNQQKVVITKSAVQKPKLVIFDEPTGGVDVGSIVEIHRFIIKLANTGIAVVVISSYLPEILALSDCILVARQGRIEEEMDSRHATEQKIMFAAVH